MPTPPHAERLDGQHNAAMAFEDALRLQGESHGPNGERCVFPSSPEEIEQLLDQFALWRLAGKSIGIVDGSFDVPQPNHQLYLIQCRALVAIERANKLGEDWSKLTDAEMNSRIESPDVVLVATVDSDEKVKMLKSKKGGIRPVYNWGIRAQNVAAHTIGGNHWMQRPVVDIVTTEGATEHTDTPLGSFVELAACLKENDLVDTVIVFQQEEAHSRTARELISNGVDPSLIAPHNHYRDERTGQPWSSSGIIKLIRGEI